MCVGIARGRDRGAPSVENEMIHIGEVRDQLDAFATGPRPALMAEHGPE